METTYSGPISKRGIAIRIAVLLLAFGAILRIGQYVAFRSLSLDEAMLSLNIVGRAFGELIQPLGESQAAPWVFLWVERAVVLLWGPTEAALRLFPLLAGLGTPVLCWLAARREHGDDVAAVVAAITAVSPLLLYYSNEVKPYGLDAFVCAGMILLTQNVGRHIRGSTWTFLGAGLLAVSASFTAVFVLPACWLAVVLDGRVPLREKRLIAFSAPVFWSTMLGWQYFLTLRPARADGFFALYFRDRFLAPWNFEGIQSMWRRWKDLSLNGFIGEDVAASLPDTLLVILIITLLGLSLLGVRALYRDRGLPTAVMISGPVLFALTAALLKAYPVVPRLWVFSVPLLAMMIGTGLYEAARFVKALGTRPRFLALGAMLLVAAPSYDAFVTVRAPYWKRTHIKPLLTSVHDSANARREPVFVSPHAVAQWVFYTFDWEKQTLPATQRDSLRAFYAATCSPNSSRETGCAIFGHYSGLQYAEGGLYSGKIGSDWARLEIEHLRSASSPCGWILMHLPLPGEPLALAQGIQSAGGEVMSVLEDHFHKNREAITRAFHVCFPKRNAGS